jgi:hypothetical protein
MKIAIGFRGEEFIAEVFPGNDDKIYGSRHYLKLMIQSVIVMK